MKKVVNLILMVVLTLAICVAGCDKDSDTAKTPGSGSDVDKGAGSPTVMGIDVNKPVAEIKALVEKMDVEQIKATAVKYKEAIAAKAPEVEELTAKIKEIPLAKMVGEEYKNLKAELDELAKTTGALKERYDIYVEKLKELKVDISDLKP